MIVKAPMRPRTSPMEVPRLVLWFVQLPLVRRLGLARRPQELARFAKFASVGALGMLVDLSILSLFFKVLLPPAMPSASDSSRLLVAASISFTVAVFSNFTWNRLWTFPESRERAILPQLGQFALVNVVGLGINNLVLAGVYGLVQAALPDSVDYLLAKVLAIGVVLFWNYGANRLWTYKGIS